MSALAMLAPSPSLATWLHLLSVFALSLAGLLALGRAWRLAWARVERCAPSQGVCWRGKRDVPRRVLILACVFVISTALTFAP